MIEMLIATSVIVVSLLAILALVNRSLGLNRVIADQYTGTYLAEEGIEVMKNFYDRSYLATSGGNFYGAQGANAIADGVYRVAYNSAVLNATCSATIPAALDEPAVDAIFESCGSNPLMLDPSGFYGYTGTTQTKFERLVIVKKSSTGSQPTPLELTVVSAVRWATKGGTSLVRLEDKFLPWRMP